MLLLKVLRQSIRLKSSKMYQKLVFNETAKPDLCMEREDGDIIINPTEEYIDEYMKVQGNDRRHFKRNDLAIWKNSYGKDYKLAFVVKKGTKDVISTMHGVINRPIAGFDGEAHSFFGFGWIHPECRTRKYKAEVTEAIFFTGNNMDNFTGMFMPTATRFWKTITGGHHKCAYAAYISYYEPEQIQIPEGMKFDDIIVKDIHDVPESDVIKYDNSVYPYERSKYIITHLKDPAGYGRVAYDKNGKVVGFAGLIVFPSGEVVPHPIYADSPKIVQAMFLDILKAMPLGSEKLTRFHVRSVGNNMDSFEWIKPFIKGHISREVYGYYVYSKDPPKGIDYSKVYIGSVICNCFV